MKIYTKTGDKGTTMLLGGTRVAKHHIKIEAYGEVDGLNAYVGMLIDTAPEKTQLALLEAVQNQLFTIGSYLSLVEGNDKVTLPKIEESWITDLENHIDEMDEQLPPLKNFVLPGGSVASSHAHIARCACRKAERRVSQLAEVETIHALIIPYINRLSDYLFALSRYWVQAAGAEERPWIPSK
jgi:cob(I)alamin adenosyltransferase